ncbi:efflux RND transporter periplasmic adaptor subunit [Chitiniphilus purpureus]|uniref:Efflux RND transporter periplasmic adaptor subunit n=1 Tax=Chitiniphilus purpureus TaxID=2981137 RepID=A0ABY6DID0_9NEIS|nr:efflux RND transporter periplasmic adaptor subunit [Chitiniphilus sp. CD1]UXY14082.1 efflux RND transporter periplasmic adaptor subunit [Chitiniphilus sp. CD1]
MQHKQTILITLLTAAIAGVAGYAIRGVTEAPAHAAGLQEGGHADHAGEEKHAEDSHDHGAGHGDGHGHDGKAADGKAGEGEEHGEEGLVMTQARLRQAGITIETAGPGELGDAVPLPGELRFNQDRLTEVTPRLAAVAVSVHRNLGDTVKRGDLLAVLESQTLAEWRSAYLANRKRAQLARITYQREQKLWQDKVTAEQDYLAAQKELDEAEIALQASKDRLASIGAALPGANRSLARYELRAPLDGTVIEKHLTAGEAVKEDATLFQIADLSDVWAEFAVYPRNLEQIKLGQQVTVRAGEGGIAATGKVAYIGALVGEKTRTATARVTLPNPDGRLRPGMFVNIEVAQGHIKVPVAVKADAIQSVEGRNVVFVREGERFEPRPVVLGRQTGSLIEIRSGLKSGQRYAAANSFVVKAELGKATAEHSH